MTTPTLVTRDGRFAEYEIALTTNSAGGAHTAGDAVCGKVTLEDAILPRGSIADAAFIIRQITLHDLDKQDVDYDVIVFDADPDGTTFTANTALDVADADLPKVIGVVDVDTASLYSDNGVVHIKNPELLGVLSGTSLYLGITTTGTPTYTTTAALTLRVLIERL